MKGQPGENRTFTSDVYARKFIILAFSYLLFGLLLGVTGGFQYILPDFLKEIVSFQKTRPLHVYLVITWIFTAAQGAIYYFIPRVAQRQLKWPDGIRWHFFLQLGVSLLIISCFFAGKFGGREYLEFPPVIGGLVLLSWLPFAINFFATLRPNFKNAPLYVWSWSTGILFFYITVAESYLWLLDHFNNNLVRDITVQWKALGSMVGSWNMLVYGAAMYAMEKVSGNPKIARSKTAFALYFVGLTNLMFNWGHHTYIVPAAPWIKTVAYLISMTELLILGQIIWRMRRTIASARKNYHLVPFRLLSFADAWIFINLVLAILISIPAINQYTHGTHITVAHAMGATIGINTMLLLGIIFYVIRDSNPYAIQNRNGRTGTWMWITNFSLLIFFLSLVGSGLVRMFGKMNGGSFQTIMENSKPWFRAFSLSGVVLMAGLTALAVIAVRLLIRKTSPVRKEVFIEIRSGQMEEERLN
jgi:nitric oxide reductase subunit B